jgi:hypothetical protein
MTIKVPGINRKKRWRKKIRFWNPWSPLTPTHEQKLLSGGEPSYYSEDTDADFATQMEIKVAVLEAGKKLGEDRVTVRQRLWEPLLKKKKFSPHEEGSTSTFSQSSSNGTEKQMAIPKSNIERTERLTPHITLHHVHSTGTDESELQTSAEESGDDQKTEKSGGSTFVDHLGILGSYFGCNPLSPGTCFDCQDGDESTLEDTMILNNYTDGTLEDDDVSYDPSLVDGSHVYMMMTDRRRNGSKPFVKPSDLSSLTGGDLSLFEMSLNSARPPPTELLTSTHDPSVSVITGASQGQKTLPSSLASSGNADRSVQWLQAVHEIKQNASVNTASAPSSSEHDGSSAMKFSRFEPVVPDSRSEPTQSSNEEKWLRRVQIMRKHYRAVNRDAIKQEI